ncbi:MAG TPA: hypothetical protein VGH27_04140 [Streptosporangiaceae bacterium]
MADGRARPLIGGQGLMPCARAGELGPYLDALGWHPAGWAS